MNSYELTVVLPGKVSAARDKSTRKLIEKLVEQGKGRIKKVNEWGKLELSYPIAKNDTGVFIHYELKLDTLAPKSISDKLKMEEGIIRYLLVRKD